MIIYMNKEYPDNMDAECINICDALNCLPGIETLEACCGHAKDPFRVFFRTWDPVGVFFVARCTSVRYWQYGDLWDVTLDVSDALFPVIFKGPRVVANTWLLPVTYLLESKVKGKVAYSQVDDLTKNIVHHLNHKAFIEDFNIDLSKFEVTCDEA